MRTIAVAVALSAANSAVLWARAGDRKPEEGALFQFPLELASWVLGMIVLVATVRSAMIAFGRAGEGRKRLPEEDLARELPVVNGIHRLAASDAPAVRTPGAR
jgi:hypothetical protein